MSDAANKSDFRIGITMFFSKEDWNRNPEELKKKVRYMF
jgi:hypothetical protein